MFNAAKVIAVGAMLVGLSAATAHAGKQDFELVNLNRSASIVRAWLAGAGTSDPWEEIKIREAIGPRATRQISVDGYRRCRFDIKVRFDDGVDQRFDNIDLCSENHVVAD